jgi:hypothetical protein
MKQTMETRESFLIKEKKDEERESKINRIIRNYEHGVIL